MPRLKRHPGLKRRIFGWAMAVVLLVVAAVTLASRWWDIRWQRGFFAVRCCHGDWEIVRLPVGMPQGLTFRSQKAYLVWGYWMWQNDTESMGPWVYDLWVPAWPPVVIPATLSGILLWSGYAARRRALVGMCRKCGYDHRGLPTGSVCPECGKTNAAASSAGPAEGNGGGTS
jgi:hypothetical protein